jgi:DNA-entry nuclease
MTDVEDDEDAESEDFYDEYEEEFEEGEDAEAEPESAVMTYILNTNTKKFHYPDCRSVKAMKDKNKLEVEATREEVIEQGYDPCGNCNP